MLSVATVPEHNAAPAQRYPLKEVEFYFRTSQSLISWRNPPTVHRILKIIRSAEINHAHCHLAWHSDQDEPFAATQG